MPDVPGPTAPLLVTERGTVLAFTFADLMRFHGPGAPGGVAHAFKVLERGLPLLGGGGAPPERRELTVATAFGGPGARDGIELVTRAVSDGRFVVDPALRRPGLGPERERFVFRLACGGRAVELVLREGFVTPEFAALAFAPERDAGQDARLEVLKPQLAARLMGAAAEDVYDATVL
ncbi:hypothetical protein NBH00_24080 [Paraconexibacter antarcticus]|uniref:Uncharacterized protein n=1 Tax=Paraconexibacter antarcticus TaxID=2949664 RepID=A0ABY5DQV1_9ACTN|nr:hypothetical protein [Paraconexibacter antarcticus]UTI64403.1 hypothetical protein NBH00_24080 [Paraconexibacter antarcticus]